jgi:DNA-binding CsgD family transcriptional regulator
MTGQGSTSDAPQGQPKRLTSRGDLTAFLTALMGKIGADGYMLVAVLQDHNRYSVRIVASNWIYDAIQLVGNHTIAALAQSNSTVAPGIRPRPIVTAHAPHVSSGLTGEEMKLLEVLGHGEIYGLRLNAGRQRLFMLVSSHEPGRLDPVDLMKAQVRCCYALSQVPSLLAATAQQDPLSDRERECLFWVSEGKTTDEVAVILGVSSNTVNSYITHAMQKFSAPNRAKAVATAVRSGII